MEKYDFGQFTFKADSMILLYRQQEIDLTPKVSSLLHILLKNQNQVLSQDFLIEQNWPDTYATGKNVSQSIFTLRQVLTKADPSSDFIQTLPKKGYRFKNIDADKGSEAPSNSKKSTTRGQIILTSFATLFIIVIFYIFLNFDGNAPLEDTKEVIAILPFEMRDNNANKSLSLDITDELRTQISMSENLMVVATLSSRVAASEALSSSELGKLLGAKWLLEGSVKPADNDFKVNLQLILAEKNINVWSKSWIVAKKDIWVQSRIIALDVLEATGNKSPPLNTVTPKELAFQYYLEGEAFVRSGVLNWQSKAIQSFEKAQTIDPDFIAPTISIATTLVSQYESGEIPLPLFQDKSAPLLALLRQKSETSAQANATRGLLLMVLNKNKPALTAFDKAISLNPNQVYAYHWAGNLRRFSGEVNSATELLLKAHKLDPLNPSVLTSLVQTLFVRGNYKSALNYFQKAKNLGTTSLLFWQIAVEASLDYGDPTQAVKFSKYSQDLYTQSTLANALVGYAQLHLGENSKAIRLIESSYLKSPNNRRIQWMLLTLYATLGEVDKLERISQILLSKNQVRDENYILNALSVVEAKVLSKQYEAAYSLLKSVLDLPAVNKLPTTALMHTNILFEELKIATGNPVNTPTLKTLLSKATRLQQLGNNNPRFHLNLAALYHLLGDEANSKRAIEKANQQMLHNSPILSAHPSLLK